MPGAWPLSRRTSARPGPYGWRAIIGVFGRAREEKTLQRTEKGLRIANNIAKGHSRAKQSCFKSFLGTGGGGGGGRECGVVRGNGLPRGKLARSVYGFDAGYSYPFHSLRRAGQARGLRPARLGAALGPLPP